MGGQKVRTQRSTKTSPSRTKTARDASCDDRAGTDIPRSERAVPEGPDNLRARAAHFGKKHGTKR